MWSEGGLFFVLTLLAVYISHWIYKWSHPKCSGILPPGSMGFPLIGETLQLFTTSYSLDLPPFIKTRIQRYGPIFRTSLGGRPVVVSADPKFNHSIVLQEGRSVELWYLDSFSKIFAQDGESKTTGMGAIHRYVRKATLSHFGSEVLKTTILPLLEVELQKTLHSWSTHCSSVDVKLASSSMIFDLVAKLLFSYDAERSPEKINHNFADFLQSLMSFPLNIPGTTFHKCLQGREKLMKKIKEILKQRLKKSPENGPRDYLDQAIKDMKTEESLNEDFIVNFIFGLLFSTSESISTALTLVFNFLFHHPAALEELRAEQEAILKNRENSESSLTWDEYKSMTFTQQVINETLRLGSVAPGLLRRTTKDILVNGYSIPQGWTIMLVTTALHLNPETFKDPLVFDPWRWKDLDSSVIAKNFMPFGGGIRQCAGADFSRLFLATFLHVLITNYRWTNIKVGKVRRSPTLGFGDGIHINLSKIDA